MPRPFSKAQFIKWFLLHVCLNNISSKSLLFIFLLDETEMAQINSVFVFVRKTSNDSCRSPNLRIDMSQVTNLKSLGFTWKNSKCTLSFYKFLQHFCNRPCKTNICISCCRSRWLTCTKPMKLSAFTSPRSTSGTGGLAGWQVYVAWLPSISLVSKSK